MGDLRLIDPEQSREGRLSLEDSELDWYPAFLPRSRADALLEHWLTGLPWHGERIRLFGRELEVPRRLAWFGDPGARYRYSGVLHEPRPWTPALAALRDELRERLGYEFNSVLANLYRDGRDAMGWHADDEPELGVEPVIASLSLGGVRRLRFRHRRVRSRTAVLDLHHGSLLLMAGPTQQNWQHCVPRTRRPVEPRINLTFRRVLGGG